MTNKHILIVEDEILHAKRIINLLKELGFEKATVCENAKDTLLMIKEQEFDLILMDIGLENSRLNGIALAKKIKAQSSIPIIFITSFSDETNIENSIDINLGNYLVKPVSKEQLFANLKIALAKVTQLPISVSHSTGCPFRVEKEYMYVSNNRGDFDERIKISELNYVRASNNYVMIITDKKEFTVPTTLKEFMAQFTNSNIVRVNRSHAVNKMKVVERNNTVLILADKSIDPIKIGRHYKQNVDLHFETLKTAKS